MSRNKENPYKCFPFEKGEDGRQFSPSSQRNAAPILKVLKTCLPKKGTVLEVAAGTGEHSVTFAPQFPALFWLASDPAEDKLASIRAWQMAKPSTNLLLPVKLDAGEETWPVEDIELPAPISAIICINMVHVAPWKAARGLLAGAGRILEKSGVLYLYGAYKRGGKHTAPSNVEFDAMLKKTDPDWGVRDLDDLETEAKKRGLKLEKVVPMPANNFSILFKKS